MKATLNNRVMLVSSSSFSYPLLNKRNYHLTFSSNVNSSSNRFVLIMKHFLSTSSFPTSPAISHPTTSTATTNHKEDQHRKYSSHFLPPTGLGVLRQNETDDINALVQNFTSPALARALREKEMILQTAARLLQSQSYDELKYLLDPYKKEFIERRRKKKHEMNLSQSPNGFTKRELVIIQRYLHRMPRHMSSGFNRRASVVIPLCNVHGVASILFEKRSDKVRTHKQEICFPGGMVEEGVSAYSR